jgi:hypothetical protein
MATPETRARARTPGCGLPKPAKLKQAIWRFSRSALSTAFARGSGLGFRWSGGSISSAPSHSRAAVSRTAAAGAASLQEEFVRRGGQSEFAVRALIQEGALERCGVSEIVARLRAARNWAAGRLLRPPVRAWHLAVVGDAFRFHLREIGQASRFSTRMGPAVFRVSSVSVHFCEHGKRAEHHFASETIETRNIEVLRLTRA